MLIGIKRVMLHGVCIGSIEPSHGEWITRRPGAPSVGLRWFTKIGGLRYLESAYEEERDNEIVHWSIDL